MVIFPCEFNLPCVFKSERILVGNYLFPKMIDYIVKRMSFPSGASYPSNSSISTPTTSCMTGISSLDPGIDNISLTISLDLTNISLNLKLHLESIIGIDLRPERRTILSGSRSPMQECGAPVST